MATSHGLSQLTMTGRDREGISSSRSSISDLSTSSVLSLLPGGSDLRETFHRLKVRLIHSPEGLDMQDRVLWDRYQNQLARLIWNNTAHPDQTRQDTSFDAKVIRGKKVVIVGCHARESRLQVESILKDSGAINFVQQTLGFDTIQVDKNFKGHLAKTAFSSEPIGLQNYRKHPFLGMSCRVHGSGGGSDPYFITTLGGVVLVDGKPYALATGRPFSHDTSEKRHESELVLYSYSGGGATFEPGAAQEVMRQRKEDSRPFLPMDWALVSLPDDALPPNSILNVEGFEGWPWPSQEESVKLLVARSISEQDLKRHMDKEGGRVACLTFPTSSSATDSPAPVPGFIASGTSTIILSDTVFTVLRVDMLKPLEYGDSGSWVLIGNVVCGIIIAGDGRPNERSIVNESDEDLLFSAYMIPMKDVMENISQTLHVDVSLPTLVDHRIHSLQSQRQTGRWNLNKVPPRALEMEFLLSQQEKNRRRYPFSEVLKLENRSENTPLVSFLPHKLSWPTRKVLEDSIGLHNTTIHLLTQLGDAFPLSAVFRRGLRRWATDYRKSRWHNRYTFVCGAIVEQCLQTEAGENLLGFLVYIWKIKSHQMPVEAKKGSQDQTGRITWLAQLLSTLFYIMAIPKTATPSTEQIQSFIYILISAFKDKDLKHFYLAIDPNYETKTGRPNSCRRAWRSVKAFVSGNRCKLNLISLDTILTESSETLTTLNSGVASMSRFLVLVHNICSSDRRQMLVYSGEHPKWVGSYAAVVLGLDVQFRRMESDGARAIPHLFQRLEHMSSEAPADMIVYLDVELETPNICEIIDRIDVGQRALIGIRVESVYQRI